MVDIVVSKYPDLEIGILESEARDLTAAQGLVAEVIYVVSTATPGTVVGQSPPTGDADPGATFTILIAKFAAFSGRVTTTRRPTVRRRFA